jgi:hypothetical protein
LKILGDYDAKKKERINHDMNDEEIKNKPKTLLMGVFLKLESFFFLEVITSFT